MSKKNGRSQACLGQPLSVYSGSLCRKWTGAYNRGAWRRWTASFFLHTGVFFFPYPEGLHAAFIKLASPDNDLIRVADVVNRRDLTARKLLTILMGQHLQLELRAVLLRLGRSPSAP